MGRAGKIARRTFLIGSAAIAGGVAFGYYTYQRPLANPLKARLPEGAVAITPYVLINQEGVTLITPRTDMGQGAYSIQAHLIAEELDIDPEKVTLSPGVPSATYYNGKGLEEGLPIRSNDDGMVAAGAKLATRMYAKVIGFQVTGGSSTVPDAYEKLRIAGAVARQTLVAAAARQTGLDKSQLSTKNGAVIRPDGIAIPYTALAVVAAGIEPPHEVELRDPSQWRYLGKPMQRLDIVAKSTGTQIYGIDVHHEGMAYATVRTNPRLGGEIKSFDASEAEQMPGVHNIVPITNGIGVIASNSWYAFRAAEAVIIEWGDAPYPPEMSEQWAEVEKSFDEEHLDSRIRDDGDVDRALDGADVVHDAEYRVPYLAHAPLEPMNAVVLVTDQRVDVWTGTQIPRLAQASAAKLSGLIPAKVHLHAQMCGGSFGRRLEDDYVRQAVEVAMAVKGTPVKMTWSREEDMTHDLPRPLGMARARGSLHGGRINAFDLQLAAPALGASMGERMGLWVIPGFDGTIVAGAWDQPFAIPHLRVSGYRVPEMLPVSSWRSVGASISAFSYNCFLDELCRTGGLDFLSELIRLCTDPVGRKVLETVGQISNWGSDLGPKRGRGLAYCLSFGVPTAEVIEVSDTDDGIKIDRAYVVADVGRILDPVNFENQVMGGVIWGLGHAMNCELTIADGMIEQQNYYDFEAMRMHQVPEITVKGLENSANIRGIGEPPVPPAAPALANAIFDATGKRIRELPLFKQIDFA